VARCGAAAEAEKLARDLEVQAQEGKDPYVLFQVACAFALCSEAKDAELAGRCRDQAFRTLEKLLQAGWKDHIALKNDPDLDPIRSDPRFPKLMTDLGGTPPAEQVSLGVSKED